MQKIKIVHLNFNLPTHHSIKMNPWSILEESNLDVFSIAIQPLVSLDPINFPIDEVEESLIMKTGSLPYAIDPQPETDRFYSIGRTGKVLMISGKNQKEDTIRVA